MRPSENLIQKYKKAYQEIFGEEISIEEAAEELISLANLLKAISTLPNKKTDSSP